MHLEMRGKLKGLPLESLGQPGKDRMSAHVKNLPPPSSSSLCPSGIMALYFWSSCSQAQSSEPTQLELNSEPL